MMIMMIVATSVMKVNSIKGRCQKRWWKYHLVLIDQAWGISQPLGPTYQLNAMVTFLFLNVDEIFMCKS